MLFRIYGLYHELLPGTGDELRIPFAHRTGEVPVMVELMAAGCAPESCGYTSEIQLCSLAAVTFSKKIEVCLDAFSHIRGQLPYHQMDAGDLPDIPLFGLLIQRPYQILYSRQLMHPSDIFPL